MSIMIETRATRRAFRQGSHSNVVTSVAFSPDGETLASGSWDGTIKLWDIRNGGLKLKGTLRGEWDEVEAIAFSPDGSILAGLGTGFDGAPFGAVTFWSPGESHARPFIRESGKLDAIAFSPDGSTMATANGDCRSVTLWEVATGRAKVTLAGHRGPIWSVAFSPDGGLLATGSGKVPAATTAGREDVIGEIKLWDLSDPDPAHRASLTGHGDGIAAVAFSPDGSTLASGGFDRDVKLWTVATGETWATLSAHEGWVAAVAFSPDGSTLATGSHDQTIKLWDAATGHLQATLRGHTGNVYAVAFSPDGSLLASGSLDGTVRIWETSHTPRRSAVA